MTLSRGSMPLILLLLLLANDPPITPPVLLPLFAALVAAPALIAWSIERAYDARWEIFGDALVVAQRRLRHEIPFAAVAKVQPWTFPLPGPGFTLRTRSGRSFRFHSPGLANLLETLAASGVDSARLASHPIVFYAAAKDGAGRRRWYHPIGKFVLFALLPTAPLFNVHQFIAYGGTLGEYYLLGLRSYLTTFFLYWSTVSIYLVLYASVWRGLAEGVALATAWIRPGRARIVRVMVERACSVLYYAGVPAIVALRFWP